MRDRGAKRCRIGDVMIGGEYQHHRIVSARHRLQRGQRDCRRGVARSRFQHDRAPFDADRATLFGDDEAMVFVADQIRWRGIDALESRNVSCSIVCAPVSFRNCFGYSSRESGHRRVPAPPASTTGRTDVHLTTAPSAGERSDDPPAVAIEKPDTGSKEMHDPPKVATRGMTTIVRDAGLRQLHDLSVVLDAQRQVVVFEV